MPHQFNKHYTLEEARALLPELRQWLVILQDKVKTFNQYEKRLSGVNHDGSDLGGQTVNEWTRVMTEVAELFARFHSREIQIKDLDRGLIDFPTIRNGQEVFLCWEMDEADIQFWHTIESGFAGREPVD